MSTHQVAPPDSERGYRRTTQRTQRRLLNAAGELLRLDPSHATMPAIAERADLSIATAYRYFPTLEELHSAYLHSVAVNLRDFSLGCSLHGTKLFEEVAYRWVRLLRTYGKAMIQVRSREGFLSRLHAGDPVITTIRETWERPIREVMRELGLDEEHFDYALMVYNALFDPREIGDLMENRGSRSEQEVLEGHIRIYYGALNGLKTRPVQ